jgi:hypothetical protein
MEQRLAGHVTGMEGGETCTGYWWRNLKKRDHWEDSGVGGRITLRSIFKKWDVGIWTGLSWLRLMTVGEY